MSLGGHKEGYPKGGQLEEGHYEGMDYNEKKGS